MLRQAEVPHHRRKDLFSGVCLVGWDVGRDEEKRYGVIVGLRVIYSPRRFFGCAFVVVLLEEIS